MAKQIKKIEENKNIEETTENIESVKNRENKNEVEVLKAENKNLKAKLKNQSSSFESKFNELKAQIELLAKLNTVKSQTVETYKEEPEEVAVGCRAFSGAALANNDGSIVYTFNGGEEKFIDMEDLKQVLRENGQRNNKRLFQNGLFYFVDEKFYTLFKIKKNVDLSKEHIADIILTKDKDEMIRKVKEMTNDKSDMGVTHTFKFMVAEMLLDEKNPLANLTFDNKKYLETYLGNNFDDLISSSGIFKFLSSAGRRK